MCTVTIIPVTKNEFILTSNRDEAPDRLSIKPDFYDIEGVATLFPKDKIGGGTWIGLSDKNRVVCVLNGGFVKHERQPSYRKSRGVVAKDFMTCHTLEVEVQAYNLDNIEPFTMIIIDWSATLKFYELVWDGVTKHFKQLPEEPQVWSSSTLYNEAMKRERQKWFEAFKSENELNEASILKFHTTAGAGNKDYGVIMDRGPVKTTSMTQIIKKADTVKMRYESFQDDSITSKTFNLQEVVNE